MLMQITNPSTKIALKIHAAKCFKLTDMLLALLFTVPTLNKYNHQVPADSQASPEKSVDAGCQLSGTLLG